MCVSYSNGTAMATAYQQAREQLEQRPLRWLVTGAAGFIGSHLLETLLTLGQHVTAMDNFLTGHRDNLDQVHTAVGDAAWRRCHFIEADIRDGAACRLACEGVDLVLHQAALGSVARSIDEPALSNDVNVGGFVNLLAAAQAAGARRVVYAASSAVYGDHPALPKQEHAIGSPLSPYALTKLINEQYAAMFGRCYGLETIGLRYFNVFGPRQDPCGAYAAVIPQWIAAMIGDRPLYINGDGASSRDFCYVENAVQANLLAALTDHPRAINQVYNVALNARTSLNELYLLLHDLLRERYPHLADFRPRYADFRAGDVRHSQADIAKAADLLGYAPTHDLERGLRHAIRWYVTRLGGTASA